MNEQAIAEDIAEDAILTRLLELHRDFIERCYSLLIHIQGRLDRHYNYRSVQWTGAARNGSGGGLQSTDWIQTYLGLPFVAKSIPSAKKMYPNNTSSVVTNIPEGGLEVLLFQVRWLDKALGKPPVMWGVAAHASIEPYRPVEFEPYYYNVFSKLEAQQPPDVDGTPGTIEPVVSKPGKYPPLTLRGTYIEVPLASLRSESDVDRLLLNPSIQLSSVGL
jgi:hypothetical protein